MELRPIASESSITQVGYKFPSKVVAKDSIVTVGSKRFAFTEEKEQLPQLAGSDVRYPMLEETHKLSTLNFCHDNLKMMSYDIMKKGLKL